MTEITVHVVIALTYLLFTVTMFVISGFEFQKNHRARGSFFLAFALILLFLLLKEMGSFSQSNHIS